MYEFIKFILSLHWVDLSFHSQQGRRFPSALLIYKGLHLVHIIFVP